MIIDLYLIVKCDSSRYKMNFNEIVNKYNNRWNGVSYSSETFFKLILRQTNLIRDPQMDFEQGCADI